MEWVLTLTSSVVALLLLAPLVVLLGGLMLFGLAGHFFSSSFVVSRASLDCPFSKQHAAVEFIGEPGGDRATDVLSCSVFAPKPYHVRCKKECVGLAEVGWTPSFMMPRFALLSGDVAYRSSASSGPVR